MSNYKQLEKDLFYEYSNIFKSLTLADIRAWDRVIELLIITTINLIKQNNLLLEIKNDGLNSQKEPQKNS